MRHPATRADRRTLAQRKGRVSRPRHGGENARHRDHLRALDAREALSLIYGEDE